MSIWMGRLSLHCLLLQAATEICTEIIISDYLFPLISIHSFNYVLVSILSFLYYFNLPNMCNPNIEIFMGNHNTFWQTAGTRWWQNECYLLVDVTCPRLKFPRFDLYVCQMFPQKIFKGLSTFDEFVWIQNDNFLQKRKFIFDFQCFQNFFLGDKQDSWLNQIQNMFHFKILIEVVNWSGNGACEQRTYNRNKIFQIVFTVYRYNCLICTAVSLKGMSQITGLF